jgi:multicomponent Na+:H+ antiporter subunit F
MSFLDVVLVVLAAAFLVGLLRVALGPSLADRAVAADVCLFVVISGLAVLSLKLESAVFLDVVLVATLLGFVATVSLARLVEGGHLHARDRRRHPEPPDATGDPEPDEEVGP